MYPLFELVGHICICAAFVGAARGSILVMFTGFVGIFASITLHEWLIS
jgi:hypothetical protein